MKNNILGVEGGGTKTTWALLDPKGWVIREGKVGAGNTQHLSDAQVLKLFRDIRRGAGTDMEAIGGAFAGCHLPKERQRLEKLFQKIWPEAGRVVAAEDTKSAFAGAHGGGDGIAVIAGTGSNVVGRKKGRWEKAGGWGYLFADQGSSYDLARRGLEKVYQRYDETQKTTVLGQFFLREAAQNTLEELVSWVLDHASKTEVASLAPLLFNAAAAGDRDAREVLRTGAEGLAGRVHLIARRLGLKHPAIGLVGGLFEKQPTYLRWFTAEVNRRMPGCRVFVSPTPGAIGAARMLTLDSGSSKPTTRFRPSPIEEVALPEMQRATTEQRNPRSRGLHRRSVAQLVDLFTAEERYVNQALRRARPAIVRAATLVAQRLTHGGRLFYVGAGTSGRLGIVDASEMPPTFGVSPDLVQGIIAGGRAAVFRSQEGAEDDVEAGATALRQRGVRKGDVVCGIAASGRTPFVLGALRAAREMGAATMLLTCNPNRAPVRGVSVAIDLPTGPELITGSTRLKAGTATKLTLNVLSSIAMIRSGRVMDNLMVNVQATNVKLKDRARRLVMTLKKCPSEEALKRLERAKWDVRKALGLK